METDGERLKEYILKNSKFWTWSPDKDHEVIFLGFEVTEFQFRSGAKVPTIRYYFGFSDGSEKPCDVRSLTFAGLMAEFKTGDHLKLRRNKLDGQKYDYKASKIE